MRPTRQEPLPHVEPGRPPSASAGGGPIGGVTPSARPAQGLGGRGPGGPALPPAARPPPGESSPLAKRKEPYRWAWTVSVVIHAVAFAGLVGTSLLDGCGGKARDEKPVVAKLVRLGTPRDERLLPRLPTAPAVPPARKDAPEVTPGKELQTPPPKPEPKPEPTPPPPETKPVPVPTPEPKPVPQAPPQQATAPKTAETAPKSNLDDIMKRFAAADRRGKAEDLPGQLDGDPEGDAEQAAEGERYLALLQKRLRDNYVLPSTIPEAERVRLQALVRITIEKNGRISNFRIEKGSGNPQYDAALNSAVQKSSPLPPPPEHLLRTYREGFPVRFRY